ncbi:MAG: substrate-binding domain-containing protein [Thermoflexales bacterium]|nr:substrate-binding domain-containing protein [Thermoflexales bacterium]
MKFVQFVFLLLIPALAACAPQPLTVTPEPVTLHLAVSDACAEPVGALALAYHRQKPWVAIEMEVWNDALARERLEAGAADVAALIWTEGGSSLWTHPFADDALAIIVHPAVPVEGLTLTELREVLRGRIGEWPDGTPVQVVSREEGAGTPSLIQATVLGQWDLTLTARVVVDDASMLDLVARTPGAVGYVPLSRVTGDVRVLMLDGRPPAPTADYPLSYACRWAARAEPTGALRDWLQWTVGPQGQPIVEQALRPGP